MESESYLQARREGNGRYGDLVGKRSWPTDRETFEDFLDRPGVEPTTSSLRTGAASFRSNYRSDLVSFWNVRLCCYFAGLIVPDGLFTVVMEFRAAQNS